MSTFDILVFDAIGLLTLVILGAIAQSVHAIHQILAKEERLTEADRDPKTTFTRARHGSQSHQTELLIQILEQLRRRP
jgi:hypothetical protein